VDVDRTSGTASRREARRHANAYNRAAQIGVSALQSKVAANNVKSQRAAATRKDGSAADITGQSGIRARNGDRHIGSGTKPTKDGCRASRIAALKRQATRANIDVRDARGAATCLNERIACRTSATGNRE